MGKKLMENPALKSLTRWGTDWFQPITLILQMGLNGAANVAEPLGLSLAESSTKLQSSSKTSNLHWCWFLNLNEPFPALSIITFLIKTPLIFAFNCHAYKLSCLPNHFTALNEPIGQQFPNSHSQSVPFQISSRVPQMKPIMAIAIHLSSINHHHQTAYLTIWPPTMC